MKPHALTVLTIALTLCFTAASSAKDKEKYESKGSKKSEKAKKEESALRSSGLHAHLTFSTPERQLIEKELTVYKKGKKEKDLPPGLQKKLDRGGKLPPGWEKKLNRGEIIPVEVYREAQPLPREIVIKLPPPPGGTILVTIHGKILRVLEKTREIVDVFDILP